MNLTEIKNVHRDKSENSWSKEFFNMSNAYQSSSYEREESGTTETVDDLMLRDDEAEGDSEDTSRTASSVRDIASRIPESLSAIGRDISRTIERAISAKDDYVVAVKVSPAAQEKVDQLVAAGIFRNRAEAAGFLIEEGIKTQSALFERVQQKLAEIERLRAELRGMVNERPA
jgi:Arc/MetJ-type ribon-helix-helix transcriptional regulator